MARYRKKPVVIEAQQFFFNHVPWPAGVEKVCREGLPFVKTLEGPLLVRDADWIITGIKGERYPCKPDIFDATYEKVEE